MNEKNNYKEMMTSSILEREDKLELLSMYMLEMAMIKSSKEKTTSKHAHILDEVTTRWQLKMVLLKVAVPYLLFMEKMVMTSSRATKMEKHKFYPLPLYLEVMETTKSKTSTEQDHHLEL